MVEKGKVVGIIAALSIGKANTKLKHFSSLSGFSNGLSRIKELFQAYEPKGKEIISEINGFVSEFRMIDNCWEIHISNSNDRKTYLLDYGKKPAVVIFEKVTRGDIISGTKDIIHPKELLRLSSINKVMDYLLKLIQRVYCLQSIKIADKHIEMIIKQMFQKVVVFSKGETDLLPGSIISKNKAYQKIKFALLQNKRLPIIKPVILGIS